MRLTGWWCKPAYAAAGCGCGPDQAAESQEKSRGAFLSRFLGCGEGASFGVRRPLRFLAYKLGLDDAQAVQLARILDDIKTERAQAAVDERRTLAAFADAIASGSFDGARADEGYALRKTSEDRLREAVLRTLSSIHALLKPEQRERFGHLIRTGTITL